jgi:hypothetical protein
MNLLIAVFKEDRFSTIAALRPVVRDTGCYEAEQRSMGPTAESGGSHANCTRVDGL